VITSKKENPAVILSMPTNRGQSPSKSRLKKNKRIPRNVTTIKVVLEIKS
jgi:hypothetical protein